ncbi:MAG: glycosyltransferase family 39 protein [Anaerolineaceae bacterium]|nr:glycosyltransferase family 39 protein [Anaerolineaceae bacterium]
MIFLLLLPHLLLISGPDAVSACAALAVYLAAGFAVTYFGKDKLQGPLYRFRFPVISSFCSLGLGVLFYLRWRYSVPFISWESLPLMGSKRICGISAAVLCILALFGTDRIVSLLAVLFTGESDHSDSRYEPVFIGLTASVMMTLASKCSPFFAFNDWVDPHTMFTVGKAILRGSLPYRDVYEQTGPLLLLFHSLGALISFDSLTGIWILEIIACFFFLYFAARLMRIRLGQGALPLVPVLALIVYSAVSFDQGDSAEEFCLPLVMYALWVGYHRLKKGQLPKKSEWLLIGITSGAMLWIKYSMLGFYLGWILALFLFAGKTEKRIELLKGIGWVAAGVLIISAPILIWFLVRGGLGDLFRVYFYQNIFLYPKTADLYGRLAIPENLFSGFLNLLVFSTFFAVSAFIGLFWCKSQENQHIFRLVHWTFVVMFLFIYFSGRFYSYYPMIFGIFVPFGLIAVEDIFEQKVKIHWLHHYDVNMGTAVSLWVCVLGLFCFAGNMRSLSFEKEDYPQYRIKNVIESSGIKNPTLLNYDFLDMGVNTVAGLLPNQRFFCGFNLPLMDIAEEQNSCLRTGCTDYALTFMRSIDYPMYELVEKFPANYSFFGITPTYNLYRLINR